MTTTRSAGKPLPRGELGSGTPPPATTNHPHQDRSHTDTRFHQHRPAADHLAFSFRLHQPPPISKAQKYARATSPCISPPPPAEGGPCHQLLHTVQEQLCSAQSELITILSIRSGAAAKRGGAAPAIFHIPWSGPGPVTLSTDIYRGYPA